MDKYELVLDIIEHSEKYTSEQLTEILSDPEAREIYNLLCKVESSIDVNKEVDLEAEWKIFSNKRRFQSGGVIGYLQRINQRLGGRAATVAAIIGTSIIAIAAVTVGTRYIVSVKTTQSAESVGSSESKSLTLSTNGTISTQTDSIKIDLPPVMFENEPLERIMKEIAEVYGVEIKFNNKEEASLHLYYKFDPALPLDEVVSQLNTFEQINITRNGNILNID